MFNVPKGKKSFLSRDLYSTLSFNTILGRCVYKFYCSTPKNSKEERCLLVVVDRFSNMAYFIMCHKMDDASHMPKLYFKGNIHLYRITKTIMMDKDSKFLSYLRKTL